jgi:hypothetical protein
VKKILFLFVLAAIIATGANAQRTTLVGRALSNTDTLALNFNSIGSNVKSFQITVVKVSGTVAGKVYLQATDDGILYTKLDSLTLTDVAAQTKFNIPAHTSYNSYQAYFVTSGTQSYTPYFTVVRRQDEAY